MTLPLPTTPQRPPARPGLPPRGLLAPLALALALGACSSEVAVLTVEASPEPRALDHEHAAWTRVLERHASAEGFDYAGLAADRSELDGYLSQLHAVTPEALDGWSRDQRMAFWINVYNAHIVRLVAENWPVESIRSLGGAVIDRVWDRRIVPMPALHPDGPDAGRNLSFNDIEHRILRPRFEDARIHAAINCASESCPPLRPEAFRAADLEAQLEGSMRAFVNDPERNRIDPEARTARISRIFDWFAEDFERDAGSVTAYLQRYLPNGAPWLEGVRLDYLPYSWDLNAAPAPNDSPESDTRTE